MALVLREMVLDGTGNTYLAGFSNGFALARIKNDGSFDESFGVEGIVTGNGGVDADTLIVLSDGNILLAGYSLNSEGMPVTLFQYKPDGTLEPLFGINGALNLSFYINNVGMSLCELSDGKILLSGITNNSTYFFNGNPTGIGVAILNRDGSLDTAFGNGSGKVILGDNLLPWWTFATTQYVGNNEKILVAGTKVIGGQSDMFISRINLDGSLDTSFGNSGEVIIHGTINEQATNLLVNDQGEIFITGSSADTMQFFDLPYPVANSSNFYLAKLNADGAVASSFGSNGIVETDFGGKDLSLTSILQQDGKIVMAGQTYPNGESWSNASSIQLVLSRYTNDGNLDPTFGNAGEVLVSIDKTGMQWFEVTDASVDENGQIFIAWTSGNSSSTFQFDSFGVLLNGHMIGTDINEQIVGTDVSDTLIGLDGNDQLDGGDGNDTLIGGSGSDTLNGGEGIDTASFSDSNTSVEVDLTNSTAIGDGSDTLSSIENVIGSSYDDTLIASNSAGSELDGGAGVDDISGGTADDVLIGGDGDDSVSAGGGSDLIIGGDGLGNDYYDGGDGMDTVRYTSALAGIVVNLEVGFATSKVTSTYTSLAEANPNNSDLSHIGNDTLSNIENIIAGNFNDVLIGSSADNIISGEGGNDSIWGGAGSDQIYGGEGTDTCIYDLTRSSYVINYVYTDGVGGQYSVTALSGDEGTDLIVDVENFQFSDQTFTVSSLDISGPTITSFSPTDGLTNVARDSNIVVTFNEAIKLGTGAIEIRAGSESGTVIASYDVAINEGANLSIVSNALTINPTSDLSYSTDCYVTFTSGAILDLDNNAYTGTSTYDFVTLDRHSKYVGGPANDTAINQLRSGYSWADSHNLTISISGGMAAEYSTDMMGPFSVYAEFESAFSSFSRFADISFTPAPFYSYDLSNPYPYYLNPMVAASQGGSDINIAIDVGFSDNNTWAVSVDLNPNTPSTYSYPDAAGDIFINRESGAGNLIAGTEFRALLLHEIANSLGLSDLTGPSSMAIGTYDPPESIMHYNDSGSPTAALGYAPSSPMILDVLALQYLYGKSNANPGNDNHLLFQDGTYSTIWDSGGVDWIVPAYQTYDSFGNVNGDAIPTEGWTIYMPEAALSSLVPERVGQAMSASTNSFYWLEGDFENALGTYGSDHIEGNSLDNTIEGRGGNDTIYGGSGNDTISVITNAVGVGTYNLIYGGTGTDTLYVDFNDAQVTTTYKTSDNTAFFAIFSDSDGSSNQILLENIEYINYANGSSYDVINDTDPFHGADLMPLFQSFYSATGYALPTVFPGDPLLGLEYQFLGQSTGDVVNGSTTNDFINLLEGDDAANGGAGRDVLDGGIDSNFLTGGAGNDTFFLDGRGGTDTWSTITDFASGDTVNIWGWVEGTSQRVRTDASNGTPGYMGVTYHYDLDGINGIDTSITFSGLSLNSMNSPTAQLVPNTNIGYLLFG